MLVNGKFQQLMKKASDSNHIYLCLATDSGMAISGLLVISVSPENVPQIPDQKILSLKL